MLFNFVPSIENFYSTLTLPSGTESTLLLHPFQSLEYPLNQDHILIGNHKKKPSILQRAD